MAQRWILTVVVAAVLVAGAVFAAHAIRDDEGTTPERAATASTRSTSTTGAATATSAASTTAPATTTTTVAPAGGEPPGPCGADTGPIRAAIDAGVANAQANADLASCRLAASDPSWAAAQLVAKPGAPFDPLTVILHGGAGSWAIVATGGTSAGCGVVPQQVIVDLGQFCVGSGGGA